MHAEIILTGTELLLGEIVDTNSTMLARMLREIGLDLFYKTTVGDNERRIKEVVDLALNRSDVVIVSGGLGPTVDDVTRQGVALATGRKLVYSKALETQIEARFRSFGRKMGENNKRQAWIPDGATPVENPVGTAPCFIVHDPRGVVICLPGVPRELKYQMKHAVIPFLKEHIGDEQIIETRVLRTCAIGESDLDRRIGDLMYDQNPTVGLAAHPGQVDIRLAAKGKNRAETAALIAPVEAELRQRLGSAIYGVGQVSVAEVVGHLLAENDLTLAALDTLSRGQIADSLVEAGFASHLKGDHRPLQVEDAPLAVGLAGNSLSQNPGQAAQDIARKLAQEADLGLAVVGPLVENGQNGISYLAISDGETVAFRRYQYGDSGLIKTWLSIRALDLVRRWVLGKIDQTFG
ncbi:MAG: CinA family nicotinamide mononucleotide deamidase-related protein [Anaerolineae bacterium]